jgi:hypothetical protein
MSRGLVTPRDKAGHLIATFWRVKPPHIFSGILVAVMFCAPPLTEKIFHEDQDWAPLHLDGNHLLARQTGDFDAKIVVNFYNVANIHTLLHPRVICASVIPAAPLGQICQERVRV